MITIAHSISLQILQTFYVVHLTLFIDCLSGSIKLGLCSAHTVELPPALQWNQHSGKTKVRPSRESIDCIFSLNLHIQTAVQMFSHQKSKLMLIKGSNFCPGHQCLSYSNGAWWRIILICFLWAGSSGKTLTPVNSFTYPLMGSTISSSAKNFPWWHTHTNY